MQKDIEEITNLIRSNHFVNEDAIKQGIVLRILHALGWNTFDTSIVWPEFSIEGQRVDYALCHPSTKPRIFVEVKQASTFGKGEEQLIMSYAFRHGVPIAILTDGQRWNFYLPMKDCPVSDRQFYVLDLKEREADEVETRLRRYLSYENVQSGQSYKNAEADHGDAARRRAVLDALPQGWKELLETPDESLILSVAEKIESLTDGFRPREDEVRKFLKQQLTSESNNPVLTKIVRPVIKRTIVQEPAVTLTDLPNWYSVNGNARKSSSKAIETTVEGLKELIALVPDFMISFEQEATTFRKKKKSGGEKRRWVARNREDLYQNPKLTHASREIAPGWWLGTNYGNPDKRDMLTIAKKVAARSDIKFEFQLE